MCVVFDRTPEGAGECLYARAIGSHSLSIASATLYWFCDNTHCFAIEPVVRYEQGAVYSLSHVVSPFHLKRNSTQHPITYLAKDPSIVW